MKFMRVLVVTIFLVGITHSVNAQHPKLTSPTDTTSLKMIGVLAASYLYQSYLNIGYLADLHAVDAYEYDKLDENLNIVIQIVGGVRDELKWYTLLVPLKSDSQYVDILVQTSDLLLKEAGALRKYFQTEDKQDAAIYLHLNEQARTVLVTILGMKED